MCRRRFQHRGTSSVSLMNRYRGDAGDDLTRSSLRRESKNNLMTKAAIGRHQKITMVRLSAANSYFHHGRLELPVPPLPVAWPA